MQLAPPGHVGEVAERAHHDQAGALLGVGERVGVHGHLDAEEGRAHGPADERRVPGVGRVADYRHAGGQELGARRLDDLLAELQTVERAWPLAVLQLGLRDRGLEADVPERGRLSRVRLAAGEIAQESALARGSGGVADRRVRVCPVHR